MAYHKEPTPVSIGPKKWVLAEYDLNTSEELWERRLLNRDL
jgi:hypothetical protein